MFHISPFPASPSDGNRLSSAAARDEAKDARDEPRKVQATVPAVRVEHEMVVADRPDAKHILRILRQRGCDLIVMGTRVRPRRKHRLFGGVTADVVRRAKCPVIVVAAPAGESEDSAHRTAVHLDLRSKS
jgi:nucleotide-binding universal stress UspA family protein